MPSSSSDSRLKLIDRALGLHEIISSVRQLSYMKQHSESLLELLNVQLEITYSKAPTGRRGKRQTYELQRKEKEGEIAVRERWLETQIWKQWGYQKVAEHGNPFFLPACRFIQSFQVPLQGSREDRRWGKIDLVGVTPGGLPVVIELKQEDASDTPLRMLVEAIAYACAVRRAWNEGGLRSEWAVAMRKNGLSEEPQLVLSEVPVILIAPSDFWRAKIGQPGKRSNGKVRDDAWPPYLELVRRCETHGLPVHFAQFEISSHVEAPDEVIENISEVRLPGG